MNVVYLGVTVSLSPCDHCSVTEGPPSTIYNFIVKHSSSSFELHACLRILHGIRACQRLTPSCRSCLAMADTQSDTSINTGFQRNTIPVPPTQGDRVVHRSNHSIVTTPQVNRIEISLPDSSRLDGAANYQIWSL
jgi:hypothetical protein